MSPDVPDVSCLQSAGVQHCFPSEGIFVFMMLHFSDALISNRGDAHTSYGGNNAVTPGRIIIFQSTRSKLC